MEPSLSIDTRLEAETRAVASTLAQEDRAEPMHCIAMLGMAVKVEADSCKAEADAGAHNTEASKAGFMAELWGRY